MAAEAEELRVLEPHVELHSAKEKEEIKEHEAHPEEQVDLLNPDMVDHLGEEVVEEKKGGSDVNKDMEQGDDDNCDEECM